jgi:hypothetical protein
MEPNFEPAGQPVKSIQLLNQIMAGLRYRYASLNGVHYEAGLDRQLGACSLLPQTSDTDRRR